MVPKIIYTLFVGVLLALFVGVGIAAFYPAPVAPEYPSAITYPEKISSDSAESDETRALRIEYDSQQKSYMEQQKNYNKVVSIASLVAAIIILVVSLVLMHQILFIADGLLLGGVLTLLYSIIRGFMTESSKHQFLVVSVGLVVALVLGYIKFVLPEHRRSQS